VTTRRWPGPDDLPPFAKDFEVEISGTRQDDGVLELVSSGALSGSDFRKLEDLSHLRNLIVHGFSVPEIDPGVVPFLTSAARNLIAESIPA
jgi:hypothetical protein